MTRTPIESVQARWDKMKPNSPVYQFLLSNVAIASAEHGSMVAKVAVSENMLNAKGGLHGSTSATIVDWAGGMAIASTGMEQTGLSTDIHISYVSTAKLGDILTIEGKLNRMGRNLAYTSVTILKGEGNEQKIVATGSHTKYVLRDQPPKAA